jgi:acylpyruvate hydrolase
MRLVTFEADGQQRLGVVQGDQVVDVADLGEGLPKDLMGVIHGGVAAQQAIAAALRTSAPVARTPLAQHRLLPPIPRPGKIICLGLNYMDHAAEGGHSRPEYPSIFFRCSTSLLGHEDSILRPRCSSKLDFEAELVAVVGRTARHVAKEDAHSVIAGYACFNDASIRDYQHRTAQWTIGKNFDKTGAFGPVFVTANELPAGASGLKIESRLNGTVMQSANTRDMLFPVDETVALLTECLTLEPGDLLVMGTPGGVGHTRKPPVFMQNGDVIEIEIESIGLLRNRVADEA